MPVPPRCAVLIVPSLLVCASKNVPLSLYFASSHRFARQASCDLASLARCRHPRRPRFGRTLTYGAYARRLSLGAVKKGLRCFGIATFPCLILRMPSLTKRVLLFFVAKNDGPCVCFRLPLESGAPHHNPFILGSSHKGRRLTSSHVQVISEALR